MCADDSDGSKISLISNKQEFWGKNTVENNFELLFPHDMISNFGSKFDGQWPVDRSKTIPLARLFFRRETAPAYALVTVQCWLVCGDVTTRAHKKHYLLHFTS
jgi:hypothetical protein